MIDPLPDQSTLTRGEQRALESGVIDDADEFPTGIWHDDLDRALQRDHGISLDGLINELRRRANLPPEPAHSSAID